MTAARRMGAETSETRLRLLDAAEQLMLDQGYAAVTSRRIGAAAGERPALVVAMLMSSISRFLVLEQETLHMSTGHAETVALVERFLRRYEGERASTPKRREPATLERSHVDR